MSAASWRMEMLGESQGWRRTSGLGDPCSSMVKTFC